MNYTDKNKAIAMMNFLKSEGEISERKEFIEEWEESNYDDSTFESGGTEYMILTDKEATERAEESIDQYIDECVLGEMPENLQQYFDRESFISDCISIDGRGHTLSGYDGEEHEQGNYYIYRTN